jgi:hypothetical protein
MGRRVFKSKKKLKSESFNPIEKDVLEAYLTYYHHAAYQLASSQNNDKNNATTNHDDESTIRRSNRQTSSFESSPFSLKHLNG